MNELLNLLPDFETLLKTKDFEDLSASEKSTVLKFMTLEEYETMRINAAKVIEAFAKEEQNLIVDSNIKDALINRMHKRERKSFTIITELLPFILGYKVPVYQVAILLIVGLFLIPKSGTRIVTKLLPVSSVDTVFIEKKVNPVASENEHKNLDRVIPEGRQQIAKRQINNNPPDILNQNSPFLADLVTHIQNEKTGHPIESDSKLYWRLVTAELSGD